MSRPGLGERARYWFDNWMARGPVALMLLLGAATVVFVAVLGGITVLVLLLRLDRYNRFDDEFTPWDVFWGSLMRTLDPGTMGGDQGWLFRLLMLVVTIGGLVIVASLIGIVSGAFDAKVAELRKGRSRVLEDDHTLILGWSSKVFPIVSEICIANVSRGRSAIVVLADRDKVEMEDALKAHVPDPGKTRIIVRSGDPMNLVDLEIANPHTARSIIVLGDEDDEDPDSGVIKTTLAVTNNPNRKAGAYHLVGELLDPANLDAARLVGRDEAHWVLSTDLISRITVQTCRQSGLSVVYSEILDFAGSEIYFAAEPALAGRDYAAVQAAFATSSVFGIRRGGATLLNPPAETVIAPGDELIVIAEDDDAIHLADAVAPDLAALGTAEDDAARPERTLVLGHNRTLPLILRELDEYSAPRSRVTLASLVADPEPGDLANLDVTVRVGDPTQRAVLDDLRPEDYDHIVVLSGKDRFSTQRADARTLITLLHLRDIAEQKGVELSIVSEMIDDRNRELAEVTRADDFIVSDHLVSRMLSQVSENRRLVDVFDELFSSAGTEIYLRPAELYVAPGAEVDFYTVLEGARRRGETAIGYRRRALARDAAAAYGVVVNPTKTDRLAFVPGDRVIVVAGR